MPRPTTKTALLLASQENYERLMDLINSYSPEERAREFSKGSLNRNIRDVLAHLHHWHLLTLGWYEVGMKGEKPEMPSKGYTWKTLPALNKTIRKKYENISLEKAQNMLDKSYAQLLQLIKDQDPNTLFVKKNLTWTGSTSLGAYLVSCTSSHYQWAFKFINKSMKAFK